MSEPDTNGAEPQDEPDTPDSVQQVRHQQISALVPENVARGAFSTGAIVLVGHSEFVLDFVVRMTRPHQVAARIVMPHGVMPQFIHALRDNLAKFETRFGKPPELPRPPNKTKPNIQEIYDEMKLSDHVIGGAYANGVMVGHSASEFSFDFIASFFPRSSVTSRVFLSAPQVPRLLESLVKTYNNFQERTRQRAQSGDPSQDAPPDTTADDPLSDAPSSDDPGTGSDEEEDPAS